MLGAVIFCSTVSKVLKQKDKYLFPDDKNTSPVKRNKGKFPDIERALSNWVRNQKRSGKDLTDEQIKEKAQYFATSVGNDSQLKTISSSWLEKFKQKNSIGQGKLLRRASEANIPDNVQLAAASMSADSLPLLTQPATTAGVSEIGLANITQSPLSTGAVDDDRDSVMEGVYGFGLVTDSGRNESVTRSQRSQHQTDSVGDVAIDSGSAKRFKDLDHSQTTLQTTFSDTVVTTSTYSAISSSTTFTISPDPNSASAFPEANFQRPRSQTFPTLDLHYEAAAADGNDAMTSKFDDSPTAPPSALESPGDVSQQFTNIDSALGSQTVAAHSHVPRRTASSGSLRARAHTPVSMTGGGSNPGSPTQEDARRAAETLLAFVQSLSPGNGSPVDKTDYDNLLRLTEKLRFPTQQGLLSSKSSSAGLGGLSRIPESEGEVATVKAEQVMQ